MPQRALPATPPSTARIAVLIDWQNAYRAARRAFDFDGLPNEFGNFSPWKMAEHLAAEGDKYGPVRQLELVEVHRGLPGATKDPVGYAAVRRQTSAWTKASPAGKLVVRHRPLRYPEWDATLPPEEKGIDVQLALSAVEISVLKKADVVVIFTHDSDLSPAVESIARLRGGHAVETASWASSRHSSRLKAHKNVRHHFINLAAFRAAEDLTNYAHKPSAS